MSKVVLLRLSLLLGVCALFVGALSGVHAEEVHYANIGWWTVVYKEFDNLSGCDAGSRFTDQTLVEFALLESQGDKGWALFLSNPQWDSWVRKDSEHRLTIAADNKIWRGIFRVADDKKTLFIGGTSIDFMNSLADAHSLMIFDNNQRPLTRSLLSMKDSADAIKAVVNCVREHPPRRQQAQAPEPPTNTVVSGTGFFVASNVLLTNSHVIKDCRNTIKVRYPDSDPYTATISGQDPLKRPRAPAYGNAKSLNRGLSPSATTWRGGSCVRVSIRGRSVIRWKFYNWEYHVAKWYRGRYALSSDIRANSTRE
jgi:hypothetical protein